MGIAHSQQAYQCYLFDMDGTLVNSEPLKGQALALACQAYGAEVDHHIYKAVMGGSWSVVTEHFFHAANLSPDLTEFNRHFRRHYEALLEERLELIDGVKSYLQRLKQDGKHCAVVSSAADWMVSHILDKYELNDLFEVVITQEQVTAHKPDPEAYKMALAALNCSADDALVFEDSTAGIQAGIASGCDVIAVKHAFNGNNNLSGAKQVIWSFDEL